MKLKYIKKPNLNLIADLQNGWEIRANGVKLTIVNTKGGSKFEYDSLEQFNKEWVTLKEPLLKGDLRFAIRVWLDYCNAKPYDKVTYHELSDYSRLRLYKAYKEGNTDNFCIELKFKLMALEDANSYTVEELVGTE